MLYTLVRSLASVALEWFYRDIEVVGLERIPRDGPLLLAVNHPNQLIDAMAVLHAVPRPVRITAKATLFDVPVLGALLRWYRVIPLRRAKDEAARAGGGAPTVTRNAESFRAVLDALADRQAVLIFPEGITHNEPRLAPLRTGIARLALQACGERGIRGVRIVPVGLVFERKWAPRTRLLVHVGEPIEMDAWPWIDVPPLMEEVESRLRATTLNFPTAAEAARVLGAARLLAGAFDAPRPLGAPDTPLLDEAAIARRIEEVRESLDAAQPARVARFESRLESLRAELEARGIPVNDVAISPAIAPGARFAVREGAIVAATAPIALWGRINHWAPLRLALRLGRRTSRGPEDPAMHTVVIGLVLVLAAYAVQTAVVWQLAGARWALAYLLSLPVAASWDLRFRDRMHRALRRMRAYFQFRRDPTLQPRLASELAWLRDEAVALETLARGAPAR
ncbi:MAG TPA: lysophospholipid acyltransferase family protein [Gemmatimonadaceae bacterium]|nr:lysophospholipid acyltransferase family protein [Gemmatimonadaceae bacterium]